MSFVTFNYDLSLEEWLFDTLVHSFGSEVREAHNALLRIPIHHVYGTLGQFGGSEKTNPNRWVAASQGIRTIFDARTEDDELLDKTKECLKTSEKICLLGFGYHEENIQLLELDRIFQEFTGPVFSSRFQISNAEWKRLTRCFPAEKIVTTTFWGDQCRQTIRSLDVF